MNSKITLGRLLLPLAFVCLGNVGCRSTTEPNGDASVPQGTVVAQGVNGLFLIDTDGTNRRPLRLGINADDMAPQWNPAGTEVVYHARFVSATLQVVDLQGQSRPQNSGISGIAEQYWAEYSTDGSWIYFQAVSSSTGNQQIWRIRPNGTGAERVSSATETRSAEAPSPSPNGQEVSYTRRFGLIPFELVVQNLSTGQIRSLGAGFGVRWSPDGKWLVFVDGPALVVARTDGSERRVLNVGVPYRTGLDWSADSGWVVAAHESGSIDLVSIDGKRVVPIPNTENLRQPSLLNR